MIITRIKQISSLWIYKCFNDKVGAGIFEPKKKIDLSIQMDDFYLHRPSLLPNPEIPRATIDKVLRAFENIIQMELIKVRWEEINRFQFRIALY